MHFLQFLAFLVHGCGCVCISGREQSINVIRHEGGVGMRQWVLWRAGQLRAAVAMGLCE